MKLTALPMLGALAACMPAAEGTKAADRHRGELSAKPAAVPAHSGKVGLHELNVAGARPALLYVPASERPGTAMPLVVMLHGAGGVPQHSIELIRRQADRFGFILLAPASRAATWDIIAERRYGTDVAAIDEALRQVFASWPIDPERVAIAGFSDGASYALSLGLSNGQLFRRVIAFSPGFMAPAATRGRPSIFVSHGFQDRVLPIEQCSRRLVPQLEAGGYEVDYREFGGGHLVPDELAADALGDLAG